MTTSVAAGESERLYISGLDYSVGKNDLAQLLSNYGITPLRVEIPSSNGKRLGFGFFTVVSAEAEKAMRLLPGELFRGRVLKVERALIKNRGRSHPRPSGSRFPVRGKHRLGVG
jgi:RNA recognition motif-containing protein